MLALYPGSFDPITFGHLDIIERSSKIFTHVYIGVSNNIQKNKAFFSLEKRKEMIEKAVEHLPNITVVTFEGLTIQCAQELGVHCLVRGLRAISDFEYELQIAATNRQIDPHIETTFLMAKTEFSFISSSLVKELATYHSNIESYVPQVVVQALVEKGGKDIGK